MAELQNKKHLVVYDGDCGFCQATVSFIKTLDWLSKFDFIPFQEESILRKYTFLTEAMCQKEIILIKTSGKYYGGYDAFKIMSGSIPITFLLSWFFFLPGVTNLGIIIYQVIAKNRHRIKIGDKVCKTDKV